VIRESWRELSQDPKGIEKTAEDHAFLVSIFVDYGRCAKASDSQACIT